MRIDTLRRQSRRRRGNVAVEVLLLTPIVLGLILGVVELSIMTAVNEQLAGASRDGARAAAIGGGPLDIQKAVQNHLGNGDLSNAKICYIINDEQGRPLPSGEPVYVRVEISAGAAVPDLLRFVGFSIQNYTLVGQTAMRKE